MATELFNENLATTTVTSGGTDAPAQGTQETWTVASSAMFGAASAGVSQFHVADPNAPSEMIAVTAVSGTTWTVVRGAESTTPASHTGGFTVYQVTTTGWLATLATVVPAGSGGLMWVATQNGLKCDGSTDDTAALNALLATVASAGGGTIFFPALAKILGQVAMPASVSGTQLRQAPIRLTGTMPNRPGESESGTVFPSGGLDLRYAGRTDTGCGTTLGSNVVTDPSAAAGDYGQIVISPGNLPDRTYIMAVTPGVGYSLNNGARATNASASFTVGGGKIQALGIGTLEIDHMLLCDQGTSSQPFILTTGTTLDMHDTAVLGNASKSSGTCDQDVWVAGGPGQGTALTSALTLSSNYTSLAVSALPVALLAGTKLVITNGTNTQTLTCSAASLGATSITVTSFTANANYGIGSAVLYGGQQSQTSVTSWSVPAAPFQGYGSHVRDCFFDRIRRIRAETYTSDLYIDTSMWWQSCGSNLAQVPATLTSGLTSGSNYTSLAVTALPAAVITGDILQIGTTSPGNPTAVSSQTVTVSSGASAGATSVSVTSFNANATYATGVTVINATAGIGAALEIYSAAGNVSLVNAVNNRFEFSGAYNYAIRFGPSATQQSTIIGNNIDDSNAANVAAYRFDSGAQYNLIIPGLLAPSVPLVDDQTGVTGGSQVMLTPQQGHPSLFSQGFNARGALCQYTDGNFPQAPDSSGNVWQQLNSGSGAWAWKYTPAGSGQSQIMRLLYSSAASTYFDLYTATAGNDCYIRGGGGNLRLYSGAGYQLFLGDTTRTADIYAENGNLVVTHLLAEGTPPTVAAASSSTGLSVHGQDTAHSVQLTTAASISAGASVATVTFGLSFATRAPSLTPRFALTAKNQASAAAQPYITGDSQAGYSVALANPPAGATAMAFDVAVIGS